VELSILTQLEADSKLIQHRDMRINFTSLHNTKTPHIIWPTIEPRNPQMVTRDLCIRSM